MNIKIYGVLWIFLACPFIAFSEVQYLSLSEYNTGLSEKEYREVFDNFTKTYKEHGIFKNLAVTFSLNGKWKDKIKSAGAIKNGSRWSISFSGGLARTDGMTKDLALMMICDQAGELLAGFPERLIGDKPTEISSRLNSKYYSTFVCSTLLWDKEIEINKSYRENASVEMISYCKVVYDDENNENLCIRKLFLARQAVIFSKNNPVISFKNHDPSEVSKTTSKKISNQCELDTYIAGASCKNLSEWNHKNFPSNEVEMNLQTCSGDYGKTSRERILQGFRPRCWYKPSFY